MARVHPYQSDEAKQLFEAVGRALSAWNYIEDSLAALFCDCLHFDARFPAARAYWAVHSVEVRLDMADEAVACQLFGHAAELEEWSALYNRIKRQSKQRNKLAHGSVLNRPTRENGGSRHHMYFAPYAFAYEAQAFPHTPERRKELFQDGLPKNRLYTKDILAMRKRFDDESKALRKFHYKVAPLLLDVEIRQRGPSTSRPPRGVRREERQTPKETGRQPQS